MGFYFIVLMVNGTASLIFAFLASVGSIIMIIAIVKNPLNVIRKPIHCIEDASLALAIVAGIVLLPYFGVTEILQGVNEKPEPLREFPSFISLLTDFLIASKLAIQLLVTLERYSAYVRPRFHRAKVTKRSTSLIALLFVTFCFLFSCLSFKEIDEQIYYIVFIHLFCSSSWLLYFLVGWLTYRNLKNRRNGSRTAPDESSQLPQLREKAAVQRARNVTAAKKHLQKLAKSYLPLVLSILPWFILKCIGTVCKTCLTHKTGFFWRHFSIPTAFVTDAYYPLWRVFYGKYSNTVKHILCSNRSNS